ncbi:uncharacterized protein ACVWWR_001718 [Bradyrhizobium sp. LM3.2]
MACRFELLIVRLRTALRLCFPGLSRCRRAATDRPRGRSDRHALQRRHRRAVAKAAGLRDAQGQPARRPDRAPPTTEPETIEQFAIRVAEAWKIGRKKVDDGAILVVAKSDRHLRIEVGYGLEGALTDVTSRRIIDEDITPKFRSGDFAGGIAAGVDRVIRVIDGEPLPTPSRSVNFGNWNDIEPLFFFLLFGPLVIGGILRSMFGRLFGSGITGAIVGVLAWFVIGSAVIGLGVGVLGAILTFIADLFGAGSGTGSSRGRSWSSGSSSGGWSSGSSSSGGFSGGGGSFGGGGASGSW